MTSYTTGPHYVCSQEATLLRKFTATILVFVGIAIIGGGSFFVFRQADAPASTQDNTNTQQNQLRATITFDGDSFEPEITTIGIGGSIKIVNQSNEELSFVADDYGSSNKTRELQVGIIDTGVSRSVTLDQTGTWGFRNQLKDGQRGQIIVTN